MIQSLALFAVNFLIVFYLQGVRGYDPLKAALLLIPLPVATSIIAPLGGNIADRIGARIPATIGLLIQGAALIWFMQLTPTTSLFNIGAGLALMGIGGGLFYPPNTSAAMNGAPKNRTRHCIRHTGHASSSRDGDELRACVGGGSHQPAARCDDVVIRGHERHARLSSDAGLCHWYAQRFLVSTVLVLVAAGISFVRGKEDRSKLAEEHAAAVISE